ncbi:DUF2891 domain-containing protein [Sphingobacterium hungaricum]
MQFNLSRIIYSIILFGMISCQSNQKDKPKDSVPATSYKLDRSLAKKIFAMPVHCIPVEYPNKLGQTIGSAADLKTPKALRPIFYGCYDWHSSVHGYWSVIKLLKAYPDLDSIGEVRTLLNQHLTKENGLVEKAFFEDKNNLGFERTYGWAWLFKVQEELSTWENEDAKQWKSALDPLTDLLVKRYIDYLPKLVYPIRSGQHDNSAFGLSLSLDYARRVGNKEFESSIVEHSKRLFEQDKGCPLAYEPSGSDFLSPCLEEAFLMSKIMDAPAFEKWFADFLPEFTRADYTLEPGKVKDRTDGKLVHLDGLNYSRAACLYGIAKKLPVTENEHLQRIASEHIAYSLPNLSKEDDYMGSHWLGTFALYALDN